MFHKIPVTLLSGLLVAAPVLSAQEDPVRADTATDLTITLDAGLATKHVFRGLKRSNEAFAGGVLLRHETGFYGGVYTVQPFASSDNNEVDVHAGFQDSINGWLDYDVGLIAYVYPNKLGGEARSAWEPYAGLTARIPSIEGLLASGYLYYDINREAITVELSASYSRPVVERLHARLSLFVGNVHADDFIPRAARTGESYYYHGASLDLPYHVNEQLVITVGLNYSNTNQLGSAYEGGDQLWAVGRVAYSF